MRWQALLPMPGMPASPLSLRSWTSGRRRRSWRGSPAGTAGCCPLQLRQGQGLLPVPGDQAGSTGTPGEPGLQFRHRPGQVHGTIRAQCPPGRGPGAGPSFARLFRAHPPPAGLSCRQRRSGRLLRTCKETGEARVDLLGSGSGTAETGACSAAPAGEAETQTQSGSGCRGGSSRVA